MNDISTFEHWIRLSLSLVVMHVLHYSTTKSRFLFRYSTVFFNTALKILNWFFFKPAYSNVNQWSMLELLHLGYLKLYWHYYKQHTLVTQCDSLILPKYFFLHLETSFFSSWWYDDTEFPGRQINKLLDYLIYVYIIVLSIHITTQFVLDWNVKINNF